MKFERESTAVIRMSESEARKLFEEIALLLETEVEELPPELDGFYLDLANFVDHLER